MAKQIFSNGAGATLAVSIASGDVSIQVQSGYGVLFPNPTGGDWFVATLEDNLGNIEIVRCTARTGDLLTVVRGQEGTAAQSFTNTVTRVEVRNTKGSMERMFQRSGDTMAGDLNMGGFEIQNAILAPNVSIPSESVFPVGMITLWSGSIASIPVKWALCDGSNGTPDLRDRFVMGAGTTAVGATGGAASLSGNTGSGGDHNHGGATAEHTLTEAQIPSHAHTLYVKTASDSDDEVQGFGASTARALPAVRDALAGPYGYLSTNNVGTALVGSGGSGGAHAHNITASGAHTHTLSGDNRPPFYALAYIMYTG